MVRVGFEKCLGVYLCNWTTFIFYSSFSSDFWFWLNFGVILIFRWCNHLNMCLCLSLFCCLRVFVCPKIVKCLSLCSVAPNRTHCCVYCMYFCSWWIYYAILQLTSLCPIQIENFCMHCFNWAIFYDAKTTSRSATLIITTYIILITTLLACI